MALPTGKFLGVYEIGIPLGSGGMGEVYRARDTRLQRDVAIKTLPDVFARDRDRLARFEREAQLLASLNHPNIAAIYGLEESGGVRFLVLELVEGETLAERVRKGPLPVEEVLTICGQIAAGLEAAHEKGVVHRDLKPANVKVRPDGKVKILDFGLAKAFADEPAGSDPGDAPTLTASPTVPGMILGTAAYMSPEQARGHTVDRASDIWAFGCLLYEMLTGNQAFTGATITDILGGIVRVDPDWAALPETTPSAIRSLLRRCLQKDRKRRLKDIADASIEIEEILGEVTRPVPAADTKPAPAVAKKHVWLAWTLAGIFLLAGVASVPFTVIHFREPAREERSIRFDVLAPEKAAVLGRPSGISPDGRRLAFVANFAGKTQLWIRLLDSLTAQPLAGTDGADFPFWSPDSRFIGFFAGGKLRKIDASGGPPQTLCDAPQGRGGAWNRDGVIIFTPDAGGPLYRVSSSGGAATPLTALDASKGETSHRGASFLPDGKHFLFFVVGGDAQGIDIGALDTKGRRRLLNTDSSGAYASPGYLLFVKERSLMAQRLDLDHLQLAGEAFPTAEPVGLVSQIGLFSVSDNGILAYAFSASENRQLAWFDRAGKLLQRIGPAMGYFDIGLAPDEKRAVIQRTDNDIWVMDLARGVPSRLTFSSATEDLPVWSPDGGRILFNSTAGGGPNIHWKASSGAGGEEVLLKSGTPKRPTDWSRDGRFILYDDSDPKNRNDLWVLPLFGDKKPQLFLQTSFSEWMGRFSPDGKWIAYESDESGRMEVYVQSFPSSGGKWQVSTAGGYSPRWRRDGRELFYLAPDRQMMSVEVRAAGAAFEVGSPKILFLAPVDNPSGTNRYDVSADGQRFLIAAPSENAAPAPITIVVNWLSAVKNQR